MSKFEAVLCIYADAFRPAIQFTDLGFSFPRQAAIVEAVLHLLFNYSDDSGPII